MTTVLFWDIDSTLLTTKRAGIFALEEAASEVIGETVSLTNIETAGMTDPIIVANILKQYGLSPEPKLVDQLLKYYVNYLPQSLPRREGYVLEGVIEILDALHDRTDVVSMLLTGNIEAGAQAKLTYYGLADYFSGGGFSDKTETRVDIAQQALAIASEKYGAIPSEKTYVIGDTPHDIHCGKAIGARVIAVASGKYDQKSLEEHQPWWTIPSLPSSTVFMEKIGLKA
ncbi:HAD family hydrolase [Moorena bouillonii]|uniref:Phosphatase n=1 Tax=Moorena bouillonii PNG TaxID=568701 RepID=A0A1U7N6X8_9CYAN|nr:HAD hydrolase-like protein [Moorena bouillonii]OLT61696.1 phosphatase [Moorena bouillonii PNG]